MSWRDVYGGNFLKAADLKKPKGVTISSIEEEVLRKGEKPKLVASLEELDERWVLNTTNCELLEEITGTDDEEDWEGTVVELFNDKTVRGPNGEKGGIRCRKAAAKKMGRKAKPADEDVEDPDADLDEDD